MPITTRVRTSGEPVNRDTIQNFSSIRGTMPGFLCEYIYGNPANENLSLPVLTNYYSRITDSVGSIGIGGWPNRYVDHEKWVVEIPQSYLQSYGACDTLWSHTVTYGQMGIYDWVMDLARQNVKPDSEFYVWADKAYTKLVAQFPTEVSVANFMWELREIKDLIPKLSAEFSDVVANGFLTLNFGWIPFISDLQKLYHLQAKVKSRLDYLRARWGKATRMGTTTSYSDVYSHKIGPMQVHGGSRIHLEFNVVHCSNTFTAGGTLFHTLEWINAAYAEWHAMFGSTGLLDPLSIVWEAIPYSFIADWIFSIGSWIERYGHIIEEPDHWQITRLSSSKKAVIVFDIIQLNPPDPFGMTSKTFGPRKLGQVRYTRYTRYPGLPTSTLFDRASLVSPKQLALLAALAVGHS